jgi:hypothetical protein
MPLDPKNTLLYKYSDNVTPYDANYVIFIPLDIKEKKNEINNIVLQYNQINLKYNIIIDE